MRWIVAAAFAFFIAPGAAHAWGASGHMTVCQIAYLDLTPTAKLEVDRLVAADPRYATLAEGCNLPDNPPIRDKEHYVNYARSLRRVNGNDCGIETICVLRAIETDFRTLAAPGTDSARAAALYSVGHWIGDIHQPLHASFGDDRGGGKTAISGGPCILHDPARHIARDFINLHKVWDRCILEAAIFPSMGLPETTSRNKLGNAQAAARRLYDRVSDSDRRSWSGRAPWQWAGESFDIATRPEVNYCFRRPDACWYSEAAPTYVRSSARSIVIDEDYLERFAPDIEKRLQQGGIRLAHELNRALDPACRSAAAARPC